MAYLSAARTWEHNLKSGVWGFDESSFQLLPHDYRVRFWHAVMVGAKKPRDPSAALLAEAAAILAGS